MHDSRLKGHIGTFRWASVHVSYFVGLLEGWRLRLPLLTIHA